MRYLLAVLSVVALAAGAQNAPEQRLIDEAAAALGGRDAVQALRTLTLEGSGTHYNLGQDLRPDASGQTFTVSAFVRNVDLSAGRSRTELTRTPNFPYFRGQAPLPMTEDAAGTALAYHHPAALVRAALEGAAVSNLGESAGERLVEIRVGQLAPLVLVVDRAGLPVRITSRSHHPNLGDVVDSTSFAEYQTVNGVRLPSRLTTKVDAFTTSDLRISRQRVNADLGALPAVQDPVPAPPNVTAESIGTGAWLLAGQSHHSVLLEFRDHLTLIDAPQSDVRTQAVIARAKALVPGKPLTQLVTTHHHFDHTAGVRTAMAEGMVVITHEGNRAHFEALAKRPYTISPDGLAKSPRAVTVEPVGAERTLTDGTTSVSLFHVAGNPHSDTMLMAYLPRDRVLVQVDAFSPGSAVNPYAANLLENVRRRQLQVDRIVPLHGSIVAFSELEKAAAP